MGMVMNMLAWVCRTQPDNWAMLPLRLSLGAIFVAHGAQKLLGWFDGKGLSATAQFFGEHLGMQPPMLWASLAAGGEFFGGLLVALGLLTRFGALNLAIIMGVAITQVHWGSFFLPSGIEFNLILLGASLSLLLSGGGAGSLDARLTACMDACPLRSHSQTQSPD